MIAAIDFIVMYLPFAIDAMAYLIAGASIIAAATPWPRDDKFLFHAMEMVRYLALNINHAIPIDRAVADMHAQMKENLARREAESAESDSKGGGEK